MFHIKICSDLIRTHPNSSGLIRTHINSSELIGTNPKSPCQVQSAIAVNTLGHHLVPLLATFIQSLFNCFYIVHIYQHKIQERILNMGNCPLHHSKIIQSFPRPFSLLNWWCAGGNTYYNYIFHFIRTLLYSSFNSSFLETVVDPKKS